MHFWRTTGLPGAGDGSFQSFANEPLVGNAAAASTSFHGCEQRLRQTHAGPRRFFFELKLELSGTCDANERNLVEWKTSSISCSSISQIARRRKRSNYKGSSYSSILHG